MSVKIDFEKQLNDIINNRLLSMKKVILKDLSLYADGNGRIYGTIEFEPIELEDKLHTKKC